LGRLLAGNAKAAHDRFGRTYKAIVPGSLAFGLNLPLALEKIAQLTPAFAPPRVMQHPGFDNATAPTRLGTFEKMRLFFGHSDIV
jgi:hypothetical protein